MLTQSLESPSGLGRYGPLAKELARLGHHIEIYALHPDYQPELFAERLWQGVHLHYVAPMHVRKSGNQKTYYSPPKQLALAVQATWALSQAAIKSSASIIHICKPHPMNSLAGLLAGISTGKRVFLDCDDYETESNHYSASWQKSGVAAFERWTPRHVTAVTTNTQFMADNLQQWGVPTNHIHYLPNGVDLERFEQFSEHRLEALRKQFNLAGKTVILFLGSLSLKSHPVDILLRAFAKLAPATQGLHLLIVGGGEDYDNLIALAKELHIDQQVGFVGRVPPEDAGYYYRLADISVDPIYNDASALGRSPLKLFESWACQVAFVTSKVGERERLMGDPPAGLFALPGDADDLALKLKRLAGDEMMRKELNQRGLTRLQDFSWSKLAQRAIEIYEQYV